MRRSANLPAALRCMIFITSARQSAPLPDWPIWGHLKELQSEKESFVPRRKKTISQKSPIHLRRLREHTWSHCHLHQTASGTLFTDPGSDQHQWTAAHFKSSMSLWIYMTISTGQLISLFTYSFIVLIILLFVSSQWLLLLYCYFFINSPFSYRGLLSFCRRLW